MKHINFIRKLGVYELAMLLDEAAGADFESKECPFCIGCEAAKSKGFDCIAAREEWLKGDLKNGEMADYR